MTNYLDVCDDDITNTLILERHKDIKEIETKMIQLNEMFRDISILTHDQGSIIDDIYTNTINSVQKTDEGVEQIRQAEKEDRKNRFCIIS